MLPAFTLWWREVVRFYRQRARVAGVILSPLLFWIVIGSGFGTSFRSGESAGQQHYLDYFFPGALVMIILFTSIFTMMSVIEDRNEGFLLSVLVAPVPRSAIVLGKVLGGTTLAAIQGLNEKLEQKLEQKETERAEVLISVFSHSNSCFRRRSYLFALGRISLLIPSVTFNSWKLISRPIGTLSSFM